MEVGDTLAAAASKQVSWETKKRGKLCHIKVNSGRSAGCVRRCQRKQLKVGDRLPQVDTNVVARKSQGLRNKIKSEDSNKAPEHTLAIYKDVEPFSSLTPFWTGFLSAIWLTAEEKKSKLSHTV